MGQDLHGNIEESYDSVDTLYLLTSEFIAQNLPVFSDVVEFIPLSLVTDVYKKAVDLKLTGNLQRQLSDLPLLERLLKNTGNWELIHKCLQLVLVKERDFGFFLADQKSAEHERIKERSGLDTQFTYEAIQLGLFFVEHGLYECASIVYQNINTGDLNGNTPPNQLSITFEVTLRIAHVLTLNCQFNEANSALLNASVLLTYMQKEKLQLNSAFFYMTCSMYMYSLSQYDKAYNLAIQAVQELKEKLPRRVIVDTLRQACKACIIRREFCEACVYIKEAIILTRHWFGVRHAKYADCLSDFAFYLLSVDLVGRSVKYYEMALDIRQEIFGEKNTVTAVTHEDLAYALYVHNYSRGDFQSARLHADQALIILLEVLPIDHLLLSSSKRVQALILEEVAIDSNNTAVESKLLKCAENLHLDSLRMAKNTFGEYNVQTAKHYGNLGRLYQSMKKFKEAECHHLKAIDIKEKLLGRSDYEVALSVGHLASLYNYDMQKYVLAEQLYLRSIEIGRRLFGEWYSGLEYDYRGLICLYEATGRYSEMASYQAQLADWKVERELRSARPFLVGLEIESDDEVCVERSLATVKNASLQRALVLRQVTS